MSAISHVKSNTIGDFTGTVTVYNSQGSTVTAAATDLIRPGDWNSAHNFYQTITGNTSGSSTASGTNFVLGATGDVTLSHSTAAGGATAWISVREPFVSYYPFPPPQMGSVSHAAGTTTTVAGGSSTTFSARIVPFQLPSPVTFDEAAIVISANTVAGTGTARAAWMVGLYTVEGGSRWNSVMTGLFGWSLNQNSVTAQSHTFWYGDTATSANAWNLTNSSVSVTGQKRVPVARYSSLAAGLYWAVFVHTRSSNGADVVSMNNIYCLSHHTTAHTTVGGYIGSATGQTAPLYSFAGVFSSAVTSDAAHVNVLPASINTSIVTNTAGTTQQFYPQIFLFRTAL